jgi:hypothetical protein
MNTQEKLKKGEKEKKVDSRAEELEEEYSSVGVEVVSLTTTGSWKVVQSDKPVDE